MSEWQPKMYDQFGLTREKREDVEGAIALCDSRAPRARSEGEPISPRCFGAMAGMLRETLTQRDARDELQARLDAALAVVAELQGEADNPWEVDALDRIERALRGDS